MKRDIVDATLLKDGRWKLKLNCGHVEYRKHKPEKWVYSCAGCHRKRMRERAKT